MIAALLARLVMASARHAWIVVLSGVLLTAACLGFAQRHLQVSSDLDSLFAGSLPWKQRELAMKRAFPQFDNLLVAVIDARLPEQADATAAALAEALDVDTAHFHSVRRPDASPFFAREGLMFLSKPKLDMLLNSTIDAQPFLGQLANDPSTRGLFAALSLLGMGVQQGQANLRPFTPALRAFHQALAQAAAGHPEPLSWQGLLSGSLADLQGKYRFVLAQPVLDYHAVQPGGAATAALRQAARQLPWVQAGAAHVRITGDVALADEEFASAADGAVQAFIGSAILVMLWLLLAVRSLRLVVSIALTLLLGLAVTTGFAALAVGTLNLISVAFAVLFIGIAVDFAIQFTIRFREMRLQLTETTLALHATTHRAGIQILIAASATACGFLAFVPTDFAGVAQLGLIAGTGMLVAFFCTLTFLPALLTLLRPRGERAEVGFRWAHPLDRLIMRRRAPVLAGFAGIAVLGLALLPRLQFDSDPLHTKDPGTEAMRTLRDLIEDPRTDPYRIDILQPDAVSAEKLARFLQPLPLVKSVMTLASFVPADQHDKLAMIADADAILGPTLTPHSAAAPVTASHLHLAIQAALAQLEPVLPKLDPHDPLARITEDLRALQHATDAQLLAMNEALTRFLPLQLHRLREALQARPVTIDTIPPEIARDWRLPDGRVRVQVTATSGARNHAGLQRFVAQVRRVVPDAGGPAVTIVATAATVVSAFRHAAFWSVVAITLILALALRRALDVVLVLLPLLLSACMIVIVSVVLPLPLNFANIIALPLLLGVGVSFNIYFVMNWRQGLVGPLGSATARAVLFSALTTGTAFGALALSHHPGTASMGTLLLWGLGCTLLATLLFMPALLAALPQDKGSVTPAR